MEQGQQPEQPDHRHDSANQGVRGEHAGSRIPVEEGGSDDEGDPEESDDAGRPRGDVANGFGKADDVYRDILVFRCLTNFLELFRDLLQIEALARVGIVLLQGSDDHGGSPVGGDNTAAPVRLGDIVAHASELRRRAGKVRRDDVAAAESVLDHLGVADIRGEQRGHRTALDTLDVEHIFGDLAQGVHELLGVDVAIRRLDGNQDLVGAAEVVPVFHESLHVLMLERDHLGESGTHPQVTG